MLIPYGQPVLDIKPYLPYSDSVKGAAVPGWLEVCTKYYVAYQVMHFFYQLKYGTDALSGSPSLWRPQQQCWMPYLGPGLIWVQAYPARLASPYRL